MREVEKSVPGLVQSSWVLLRNSRQEVLGAIFHLLGIPTGGSNREQAIPGVIRANVAWIEASHEGGILNDHLHQGGRNEKKQNMFYLLTTVARAQKVLRTAFAR